MIAISKRLMLVFSFLVYLPSGYTQINTSQSDKFYPKEIKGPLGIEFVLIPAGSFLMGCDATDADCDKNSRPKHKVTISKPFYLSKYEITQAQWGIILKSHNPSGYEDPVHPVEGVSWGDVVVFIHILNNAEGTLKYRLPTEAEWEYAARAGTTTRYWFGDDAAKLDEVAWYQDNSLQQTHPVGQKKPNPWGLYDMYGNVAEWVSDWWGEYSGKKNQIDPRGPANIPLIINERVIRGGGWEDGNVNSYARDKYYINSGSGIGFRLAFTPDGRDLVENKGISQGKESK